MLLYFSSDSATDYSSILASMISRPSSFALTSTHKRTSTISSKFTFSPETKRKESVAVGAKITEVNGALLAVSDPNVGGV